VQARSRVPLLDVLTAAARRPPVSRSTGAAAIAGLIGMPRNINPISGQPMLGRSYPNHHRPAKICLPLEINPHTTPFVTYDRKSTNRKDALPPWSVAAPVLGLDSSIHSRPYRGARSTHVACTVTTLRHLDAAGSACGNNPKPPRRCRCRLARPLASPGVFVVRLPRCRRRRVLGPSAAPPARDTHHVAPPDGPRRCVCVAPSRRPLGRCTCRRDGCACLPRQRHRPL